MHSSYSTSHFRVRKTLLADARRFFNVYLVYVLDGAAHRALMGHTSASSNWAIPGVRCLTKDMWKIYDIYTMDATPRDGYAAAGALLPGSGHRLAGRADNVSNRQEVAKGEAVTSHHPFE